MKFDKQFMLLDHITSIFFLFKGTDNIPQVLRQHKQDIFLLQQMLCQ